MARGGYRPGAGRPRGTVKRLAEKLGVPMGGENLTPLEFLLRIMNDPATDQATRIRVAGIAAPFVHAKAGEFGKKDARQKAAQSAANGKFAPPEPPRLVVNNIK